MPRLIDLDAEIAFVDGMLGRYAEKNSPAAAPFRDVKSRIAQRQRETRLFLGVIGEFSSGKSTLINALIRDTLLKMDNRPGTTAAATLLYHGERLDVAVRKRRKAAVVRAMAGTVKAAKAVWGLFSRPPAPTREDLLQLIDQATTSEDFAKDIVQVDVRVPSDRLRYGLVVVDTPGANATNPRHGQVTVAALRDVCDAALVVVPAEMAGSESLFTFLKEHAADVLYRCVFVVTKMDLIRRERERDRVLAGLKARIQQTLDIPNPRIVACAPQFVVETLLPSAADRSEFTEDEIRTWTANFEGMERELDVILRQKRMQAQVDDLAQLVVQLFTHLRAVLNDRLTAYRERHDALTRVIIPDVGEFIAQRVRKHQDAARTQAAKTLRTASRDVAAAVTSLLADMSNAISAADSRKALRAVMESSIPSLYSSGQYRLQKLLRRAMDEIAQAGHGELKTFHAEFQKHFQNLATLGGKLAIDGPDARAMASTFSARTAEANRGIANELKGLDQQQKFAAFGMAAGGATIGTFLFPGVGTLVGGAIGWLGSMLFGPSLPELKAKCWGQLEPQVTAALHEFATSAAEAVESAGQATVRELGDRVASYRPRYESLVQKMKDRDAAERVQLEEFQRHVEADLETIEGRRREVDRVRQQLREQ